MDLHKFEELVKVWIQQFSNCALSGVARVTDGSKILWSASLAILAEGSFPAINPNNIESVRALIQQHPLSCSSLLLSKVYVVQFIMLPDLQQQRWQIQWLFRDRSDLD